MVSTWTARAWGPREWEASSWNESNDGPVTPPAEVLGLTLPGASFILDEGAHRQGISGSTLSGDFLAIPGRGSTPNVAIYCTHDNGSGRFCGVNPQAFEAALAGYEMLEVQIAAGQQDGDYVAGEIAATLTGTGYYDSVDVLGNAITIEGQIDAGAAFVGGSYDAAGGGAITDEIPRVGRIAGHTHSTQNASFTPTTAASRLRPADIPAGPFRIIGGRIRWGTSHTGQVQLAVYQGGSGYDYQGATLLGRIGVSTGSATSAWVDIMCEPDDVIEVDPANGDVWVCWMGDGATSPIAFFSSTGAGIGAASHFDHDVATSNNAIWTLSGTPPTGSGGTFPATLPARGAASAFKPAIQLVIQLPPYRGDWRWKSRIGLLQTSALAGSSAMTGIFTSNAFTMPNALGVEWDRIRVRYAAHDNADQFRLEAWEGGAADNDIRGATMTWNAGQTTGTATGWNDIVDAGSHPCTPGARTWLSVKALSGGSSLAFGGGGVGYTAATTPAAYYRGSASESEFNAPDAGLSHDPSVMTATPFAAVGTNINNNNSVGIYGIVRIPGFSMVANP